MLLVSYPFALKDGPVDLSVLSFPVGFVGSPVAFIDIPFWLDELPVAFCDILQELAYVAGTIGPNQAA